MEDQQIVQLFWDRKEGAIAAASEKYGGYCASIAWNILGNQEDTEECVNDTYLRAWNAIPPSRPERLSLFLGRITKNLALSRYRRAAAEKRGGGQLPAVLEELEECIPDWRTVEQAYDQQELVAAINAFLETIPKEKQRLFVCRYWYADSIADLAERFGMREGAVAMALSRIRKKLGHYLLERGFESE